MRPLLPLTLGLLTIAACDDGASPAVPLPIAGLLHPEVARVGEAVTLDASTSAVAQVQPGKPGGRLVRFRFLVADGSAAVESGEPRLVHAFSSPGSYAVQVTVVDDLGREAKVGSRVEVVSDYQAVCGATAQNDCPSGLCSGEACAVLACGGAPACPGSGGVPLVCQAGVCVRNP